MCLATERIEQLKAVAGSASEVWTIFVIDAHRSHLHGSSRRRRWFHYCNATSTIYSRQTEGIQMIQARTTIRCLRIRYLLMNGLSSITCSRSTALKYLSTAPFVMWAKLLSHVGALTRIELQIMMQYYHCSRSRRGLEYHMATRSVPFIDMPYCFADNTTKSGQIYPGASWSCTVGSIQRLVRSTEIT